MSDLGTASGPSGLGGLANRIIEALSDLLDSVGGDEGRSEDEAGEEADDQPASAEEVSDVEEATVEAPAEANEKADEAVAGPTPPPVQDPATPPVQEPTAQGLPVPEPLAPAPTPNPPSGGKTPCEIAADQLPQAG
jgi:hypothetical protein